MALDLSYKNIHQKFYENKKNLNNELHYIMDAYISAGNTHLKDEATGLVNYDKLKDSKISEAYANQVVENIIDVFGKVTGENLNPSNAKDLAYLNHKMTYLVGKGVHEIYSDIIQAGPAYSMETSLKGIMEHQSKKLQMMAQTYTSAITEKDKDLILKHTGLEDLVKKLGFDGIDKDKITVDDLKEISFFNYIGRLDEDFIKSKGGKFLKRS